MKRGIRARLERGWLFVIDIRLWRRLSLLCPVLLTACQHTNSYYADTPALPRASVSGVVKDATALNPVALDNQLDPTWLKPPSQLFTLGPGDKLEIEVLGDPGSRVTTV